MSFTKRGLRLVQGLSKIGKEKPIYYDSANIFNKIKFIAANEDHLKGILTVDRSMCNGYDIMHGGYTSLVIDVMCLYAHVAQADGKMAYTTNISVNFLGTATIGEKVIAEATSVKSGRFAVMESKLYKEDGCIIAKGTATFVNASEANQKLSSEKVGFDVLKNYE